MKYSKAKKHVLYQDGSLRDIYISIPNEEGYRDLVNLLIEENIHHEITIDETPISIDKAINEFNKGEERLLPKISINISGVIFICHFFDTEELEIDFLSTEVSSEAKWEDCIQFLKKLSNHFHQPICIHPENSREYCLYEITA